MVVESVLQLHLPLQSPGMSQCQWLCQRLRYLAFRCLWKKGWSHQDGPAPLEPQLGYTIWHLERKVLAKSLLVSAEPLTQKLGIKV